MTDELLKKLCDKINELKWYAPDGARQQANKLLDEALECGESKNRPEHPMDENGNSRLIRGSGVYTKRK